MRHFWLWVVLIIAFGGCQRQRGSLHHPTSASVFSEFYIANGEARIFGEQRTEPYTDSTGRTIQYFQNMRLEFDPTTGQISITPLGEWTLQRSRVSYPPPTAPKNAFLEFYEQYNGQLLFGEPLTPEVREGEYIVQYFQNARLEWHPENPPALRVQLGRLGEAHHRLLGPIGCYPPKCPEPFIPDPNAPPEQLSITASVKSATLFTGENQTLFVRVQPIEGVAFNNSTAKVEAVLTYPDGKVQAILFPPINDQGQTEATFTLSQPLAGDDVRVLVTVQDNAGNRLGETVLSFQTWWYK